MRQRPFVRQAERFSSFVLACAFGLLSFPLLTYRLEIRPEGFSMFFCGIFWGRRLCSGIAVDVLQFFPANCLDGDRNRLHGAV